MQALTAQRCFAPAFRGSALRKIPSAAATQIRCISTQKMSEEDNLNLLTQQRKQRPSSPHFTIYEPQLTWLSSIANRVTGSGLSIGLYGFSIAYLAAPAVGLGFDAASVVDLWASFPAWFKVSVKGLGASAFWYHTFNSIRHLGWDIGYFLSLKGSYQAGYAVLGATGIATVASLMI